MQDYLSSSYRGSSVTNLYKIQRGWSSSNYYTLACCTALAAPSFKKERKKEGNQKVSQRRFLSAVVKQSQAIN